VASCSNRCLVVQVLSVAIALPSQYTMLLSTRDFARSKLLCLHVADTEVADSVDDALSGS
jgi:hypothetical protein